MVSGAELGQRAWALLGEPVEAAGVFSAGSAIAASIAGAVGGTTVSEIALHQSTEIAADQVLESTAGAAAAGLVDAAAAVAGMHAARRAAATAEGLTPVVLVAVTQSRIVLMDWEGTSASGHGPTRILASFSRDRTSVAFGRIGANRRVTLDDGQLSASFTGALGLLSSGKDAKRAVLRALGGTDL